jgi:hypothetical protein
MQLLFLEHVQHAELEKLQQCQDAVMLYFCSHGGMDTVIVILMVPFYSALPCSHTV